MDSALLTVLFAMIGGAIRVSTPFLFVSLGECLTEKSGRVNLGLEGTLVLGAMSAYAISYLTGSPWLGVFVAGCCGAMMGAIHGCGLPPSPRQRCRHRHRADELRHRPGLLLRQGVHPAQRAAPAFHRARRLDGQSRRSPSALQDQSALLRRHRAFGGALVGIPKYARAASSSARRATVRRRRARWAFRWTGCASGPRPRAASCPASAARSCRSITLASWNEGLSSGQGLMAVALVIFARWNPVRCLFAALMFGAPAPSARRSSRSASRRATISSTPRPTS